MKDLQQFKQEISDLTFGPHPKPHKTIFDIIKLLKKYDMLVEPTETREIRKRVGRETSVSREDIARAVK